MKKTVIELFAGVGGFRVGLNSIDTFNIQTGRAIEINNWDFLWANQWEPSTKQQQAYECYIARFGSNNVSNQDINLVDKNAIPNHSLLVGGFPCQDYSVARTLRNEKGIEGIKGVLFWDIAETLRIKNTPFFLLENVDRLLKSPAKQRGRDFGIMLRTLCDLGYNLEWRVINAADYGRAQRRRRVFVFGWKQNSLYERQFRDLETTDFLLNYSLFATNFPINQDTISNIRNDSLINYKDTVIMTNEYKFKFENTGIMRNGEITTFRSEPINEDSITLGQIIDNETDKSGFILTAQQETKFKYLKDGKKIERLKPNGESYYYSEGAMNMIDPLNLPGRTMLTTEGTVNRSSHVISDPILGVKRFITPIEAERLQDFPDNWTNTGMPIRRRYFMMGNALVTGIVNRLSNHLANIIENEPELEQND